MVTVIVQRETSRQDCAHTLSGVARKCDCGDDMQLILTEIELESPTVHWYCPSCTSTEQFYS